MTTEDLTPEALLRLMQRNPAWVRWRGARVDLIELEDNASSTAPEGDSRPTLDNLRHAIAALPEGTVISRLARARATLRQEVGLEVGMPLATIL
jgi:hypothetical protein